MKRAEREIEIKVPGLNSLWSILHLRTNQVRIFYLWPGIIQSFRSILSVHRVLYASFFLIFHLMFLMGCQGTRHQESAPPVVHDLPQIQDSGQLVVLTLYSSTSYFMYRGEDMGFQYELSGQFARSLGVELKIKVGRTVEELIEMLKAAEGDLIAYPLPVTKEWKDSVTYCGEEIITHQVLVQRRVKGKEPLHDVTQLVGRDVYVKPGKYYDRLMNLDRELGGGIHIHVVAEDSVTHEDLIARVARGEIPYTVSDDDVARLNRTYFPQLDVSLALSFDQRSSWAVRPDCPLLARAADRWYQARAASPEYKASQKRYFEMSKATPHTPILSLRNGIISRYDALFKKYAKQIDWDWRLLASLAYTESNFDTAAVSWAGAKGLMQLMPHTAHAMGVPSGKEYNAEESIKAAVKYIDEINYTFRSIPEPERINFVLASYNSGTGHVLDAMALAEKYGKNRHLWHDNVEKYILLKSDERYYTDSVCRNGYFRGVETYNFVRDIMMRYERYRQKIPL